MSTPLLPTFTVSEDVLVYAFRYALGRRTGAVIDVVKTLLEVWPQLDSYTQRQMVREIVSAINRCDAGGECDVREWQRILDVAEGLCPECRMAATHCLCSHDS